MPMKRRLIYDLMHDRDDLTTKNLVKKVLDVFISQHLTRLYDLMKVGCNNNGIAVRILAIQRPRRDLYLPSARCSIAVKKAHIKPSDSRVNLLP